MKIRVKIVSDYNYNIDSAINIAIERLEAEIPNMSVKDIKMTTAADTGFMTAMIIYETC